MESKGQAEKQALKSSYEHWIENWEWSLTGKGEYSNRVWDCTLCLYNNINCDPCVLYNYGFGCSCSAMCTDSPYNETVRTMPETISNMVQILLLVYLSEYNEDPDIMKNFTQVI